jgi:hypothetical protein
MKKLLFLFTGIATAAGLTSCKKEYTCECAETSSYTSWNNPADNWDGTNTYTYLLDKQSKKDAEAECVSYNDSGSWNEYSYGGIVGFGSWDRVCNLK